MMSNMMQKTESGNEMESYIDNDKYKVFQRPNEAIGLEDIKYNSKIQQSKLSSPKFLFQKILHLIISNNISFSTQIQIFALFSLPSYIT